MNIRGAPSLPKLTKTAASFPPVRACIFDMDGLLINSEDIITLAINHLLEKRGRPAFTRSIRAQLMGVPDSTNGEVFHEWAKLPIPREQFAHESPEQITKSHSYKLQISKPGTKRLLDFFRLTDGFWVMTRDRVAFVKLNGRLWHKGHNAQRMFSLRG
ncbi:uncharacterized protein RCO7_00503 [Rhynchosporium graminicola]|uniref:Uncharacterized protein n=1 Tax=Rhynchosporium graminicola TaxID=2792576 RepID=A0A1E1KMK1_9HELO|nr:uncharacterized protein RCO7_00503 [Rhynchosporium commune]